MYGVGVQLLVLVLSAGAVYGAIRSDIKAIHSKIANLEHQTEKAHDKIHEILMKGK